MAKENGAPRLSRRDFLSLSPLAMAALIGKELADPVEAMRRELDGAQFEADNTYFWVRKLGYHDGTPPFGWSMANTPPLWMKFSHIDFGLTGVSSRLKEMQAGESSPDDQFSYTGLIPNITGDKVICTVPVGGLYQDGGGERYLNARLRCTQAEAAAGRVHIPYALIAHESVYDSKIYNLLMAMNDMRRNTLAGFGPGEEISYLDLIEIGQHLQEMEDGAKYYLPGYAVGADGELVMVTAGGVCASVSIMAKAAYKAAKRGLVEITQIYAHSNGFEYLVNPIEPDTVDATAFYRRDGQGKDLRMVNTAGKRLWWVPKADIVFPTLAVGEVLPNSMARPASVWLALSMLLTDQPPTLSESQSVEDTLRAFAQYRLEHGGEGTQDGFNLTPWY